MPKIQGWQIACNILPTEAVNEEIQPDGLYSLFALFISATINRQLSIFKTKILCRNTFEAASVQGQNLVSA